MEQIQALRFDVQEVGKHVKGSKKRYCWQIALKDKSHTIVLDFSFISGKVKITVDRKILLENELPADVSFQYPFTLDGFALNIIQQGQSFELRINNKVFSHLYTQQKTNTEFKKYEDQVKDIKVDVSNFNPQNKKISLNIGAFGGGMKKKKETGGEGQSWNAFAGGSFPSYFGEEQPQTVEKAKAVAVRNLLDEDEVAERTAKEFNSVQAVKVEKKAEDIFQLIGGQAPKEATSPQQFGNMQQMFSSLNAVKQPSNQIDFFADSSPTKKEEIKPAPKVNVPVFDLNPNPSGLAGFATGFGLESSSQISSKSFATSAGGKSFGLGDLDFSIGSVKQEPSFAKKSSQENATYTQMEQAFSSQLNQPQFQPPQPPVPQSVKDFNTMRHMFDTSNFSNSNNFVFPQPEPVPAASQLNFGTTQFAASKIEVPPKPQDYSTMQLLFQTNSGSQPQVFAQQPSFLPPEPQKPNPLDMFSNSKPASFSTISGGSAFQNNNFDMSSFGTMQPNKGGLQLNFFDSKPAPKPAPSGDLI